MLRKRQGFLGLVAALPLAMAMNSAVAGDVGGLGSRWPAAPDMSRLAGYHAYHWQRAGVSYVQVNGADGEPILAVAAAGDVVLPLPIGSQAEVPVSESGDGGAPTGGTVYQDGLIAIRVAESGLSVAKAPCDDPLTCSKPRATSADSAASDSKLLEQSTSATCSDPLTCSKPPQQ